MEDLLAILIVLLIIFFLMRKRRKLPQEITCSECHIKLEIEDPLSALTKHIAGFQVLNRATYPIKSHYNFITGGSPRDIDELRLKAYDSDGNELRVKVLHDTPLRKDIIVEFNRLVNPNEPFYYTLEYYWDRSDTYDIHVQSFMRKLTFSLVYPSEVELKEAKAYRIMRSFFRTVKQEIGEPAMRDISEQTKEISWTITNIRPNTTIQFMWFFAI